MNWLNQIPLFRLIIPFSLGIIWAFFHPVQIEPNMVLLLVFLTFVFLLFIQFRRVHSKYYNRWVFGLFTYVFIFLLSNALTNFKVETFNPKHFSNLLQRANSSPSFIGIISSEPEIKQNSIKAIIEIKQLSINGKWKNTMGKCLVYFKKNDAMVIKYGDQITFLKKPSTVDSPANFDEFDYKKYLSHHYIYHRLYLSDIDYKKTGYHPPNRLKKKAIDWRNYLLKRYQQFEIEGEELAILSALTLGKKESLTPELKSAYSSAGAMHVLAVSGLHVGIIFLVLKFLLGWLDQHKIGKIIKAILLILSVWFYAFITGLSPSVIRAATMFSFMIFALSFKRTSNIYNTLALSAFTILLIQPFMLLEVGFQLSYLAVIGIIYLHPYVYNLLRFKTWVLDQAWNITCVSISAQLATAPLGILYFHQFPTYFLFSNLIVIPAAFLIMGVSIGFQSLSFIPLLGNGISYVLKGIVWLLNTSVQNLERLPAALLGGLDISVFETWLFYLISTGITLWLTQHFTKLVLYSLALTLILTVSQTMEKWTQLHQKEITFYDSGKEVSIELTNGSQTQFLSHPALVNNVDKMQFHVYHHWWKRGISTDTKTSILPLRKAITLGNTKILRIENDEICSHSQINILKPKVIYYNSYKNLDFDSISSTNYQPIIVIGNRTSKKITQQIIAFCQTRDWAFHDIKRSGALKINLDADFRIKSLVAAKP